MTNPNKEAFKFLIVLILAIILFLGIVTCPKWEGLLFDLDITHFEDSSGFVTSGDNRIFEYCLPFGLCSGVGIEISEES